MCVLLFLSGRKETNRMPDPQGTYEGSVRLCSACCRGMRRMCSRGVRPIQVAIALPLRPRLPTTDTRMQAVHALVLSRGDARGPRAQRAVCRRERGRQPPRRARLQHGERARHDGWRRGRASLATRGDQRAFAEQLVLHQLSCCCSFPPEVNVKVLSSESRTNSCKNLYVFPFKVIFLVVFRGVFFMLKNH